MLHLTLMTCCQISALSQFEFFFPPPLILFPISDSLMCTLTNNNDPAGKSRNLLAVKTPPFFIFLNKDHLTLRLGPLPNRHGVGERERSNSKLRGGALLSALHQETECESAARHHTEALLKIHVYHSSSFIDGFSCLYVYEVRGLPMAPGQWPPGSTVVSKKLPVPFKLARFQMRPDHGHSSTCISCMEGSLINSKSLLQCWKMCGFKKYLLFWGMSSISFVIRFLTLLVKRD